MTMLIHQAMYVMPEPRPCVPGARQLVHVAMLVQIAADLQS